MWDAMAVRPEDIADTFGPLRTPARQNSAPGNVPEGRLKHAPPCIFKCHVLAEREGISYDSNATRPGTRQ